MPKPIVPALPVQPLLEELGNPDHTKAAELLGTSRRNLLRWIRYGLTIRNADRLALRIGVHPLEVWGHQWSHAEAGYEAATYCPPDSWVEIERSWRQWHEQKEREW